MVDWDALKAGAGRAVKLFVRLEAGQVTQDEAQAQLVGIAKQTVDRALPSSVKTAIREAVIEGRAHVERMLDPEDP
jgi:predicted DNA-binding protein (UPF0251 family)